MIVVAGSSHLGEIMVCWARFVAAVGVVVVAALLSSCVVSDVGLVPVGPAVEAGGDEPAGVELSGSGAPEGAERQADSVASGEAVGAFHFDSGVLEIGPFDPLEVYPDVFDPCQEISAEEFAAAGFKTDGVTMPLANGSALACTLLSDSSESSSYNVLGNLVTREQIREAAQYYDASPSIKIPDMVSFSTFSDGGRICRAAVSSVRGHLEVSVGVGRGSRPFSELCNEAVEILEDLRKV
ncbi:DUF3558 domain-containing protein [Corynebacterium cystitidis]|uniref:DUF3558 domain-containing protein n=2 Tax=Corynebacterium cystitidis TaxID=35757 RepID=UPI00211EDCB4|nr:DUF3558 domain-containing protein [Corynebacterium cystitidis]